MFGFSLLHATIFVSFYFCISSQLDMPRPFGAWAPALTISEFKSRCPRFWEWRLIHYLQAKQHVFYSPEAMAHFKDPQQFKDAVDIVRRMRNSDNFWGDGVKKPHNALIKIGGATLATLVFGFVLLHRYYTVYIPATNPSWRKVVNKEWEEAINNSPWDHRSHVWQYCDVYACCAGDITAPGQRKFYIPA